MDTFVISDLSDLQQRAIAALLSYQSFSTAARVTNIPERRLHSWIVDEDFRTALLIADGNSSQEVVNKLVRFKAHQPLNQGFLLVGYLLIPGVLSRAAQNKLDDLLIYRMILDLDRRVTQLEEVHLHHKTELNI